MGSLERRLRTLEARVKTGAEQLDIEELWAISLAELQALEERIEAEVAADQRSFWDLYAVISVKSRRSLDTLLTIVGREDHPTAEERPPADEEALRDALASASAGMNGCRIWRYYRGEKMPGALKQMLYEEEAAM